MQNDNRPIDGVQPPISPASPPALAPTEPPAPPGPPAFSVSPVSTRPQEITPFSSVPQPQAGTAVKPKRNWTLVALVGGGTAALLIGGILLFTRLAAPTQNQAVKNGEFGVTELPLGDIKASGLDLDNAASLKVNGQLQVTDSVVFTPSLQPSKPVIGQLYYDKNSNQLAYFNGQQFQNVGSSTQTNVTNIIGSSQSSVLLQTTSPGVQQTGNINISGTAKLGSVETNIITSNGGWLFINPASISTAAKPQGVPTNIGVSTQLGVLEASPGWKNGLNAQKVTLGDTGGKLQSMSVNYVGGSTSSHVQFGVYEDDGDVPSKPGALVAASAVVSLVPDGWTTATLPAVTLSPNTTYWLAVNTDDATVRRYQGGGSQNYCYVFKSFGSMSDPFSAPGCFIGDLTYPLYATFLTSGSEAGQVSQAHVSIDPDGAVLLRNSADSTNAFQVQNALGTTTLFNVDTINGRIAIGKANASYKLDIAGGDINLSNGRSLRFGGLQTLTVTGSGITALSNLTSGGVVRIQGDTFAVQNRDGSHTNLSINNVTGATTFSNNTDTTAAFQIQNSIGTVLLRADTSGMNLYVGDPAGSNTPVVLYLANKNTAGDPAGAEGGTYYNSTLASFRCFHTGFWQNCADIEPQHSFSMYDDFMGGQTSFTGVIGSLGWTAAAIGANGSLVRNPATPTPSADRPGVLQIQTPASSNQGTSLMLADTTGGSTIIAKDNDIKTSVAVGAATGQVLRVGLHTENTATTQPVSGVWWEADPAASANWRYCYGNGTAATCAASSVAIAANTWVTLEIRVTATGNGTSAATFVINNVASSVSAVTIDTVNRVSPAVSCYATTGSAQTCNIDYFQFTGTTSTRR